MTFREISSHVLTGQLILRLSVGVLCMFLICGAVICVHSGLALILTFCVPETLKRVLWQTVNTQMKSKGT